MATAMAVAMRIAAAGSMNQTLFLLSRSTGLEVLDWDQPGDLWLLGSAKDDHWTEGPSEENLGPFSWPRRPVALAASRTGILAACSLAGSV
jgi:hypothetical protein